VHHNNNTNLNDSSRHTVMPFIKRAERLFSQRKALEESTEKNYDILENIHKNRKETPDINTLL